MYPQPVFLSLQTIKACIFLYDPSKGEVFVRMIPSQQITSHSYIFLSLRKPIHKQFYPSEQIPPLQLFTPLAAQNLHNFNPSKYFNPSVLHRLPPPPPPCNRNFGQGAITQQCFHCSSLQSTLTSNFWHGVIPQKSSHPNPLLHRNFDQG